MCLLISRITVLFAIKAFRVRLNINPPGEWKIFKEDKIQMYSVQNNCKLKLPTYYRTFDPTSRLFNHIFK